MQYNTETGQIHNLGTVFVYTLIGTADTGYVSVACLPIAILRQISRWSSGKST